MVLVRSFFFRFKIREETPIGDGQNVTGAGSAVVRSSGARSCRGRAPQSYWRATKQGLRWGSVLPSSSTSFPSMTLTAFPRVADRASGRLCLQLLDETAPGHVRQGAPRELGERK